MLTLFNRGDHDAFKAIFEQFFHSSCAFVNRYVESPEACEDIVQDTFINIWNKRGIFQDTLYFKAYLYKSLRNNAVYYLRGKKPGEDIDPKLHDDEYNVLQDMIIEEVHREIIAAIQKLPTQRRRIVELAMEGLSQEEIAEAMKISVNTVKTQKRKAFAALRVELNDLFVLIPLFVAPFS